MPLGSGLALLRATQHMRPRQHFASGGALDVNISPAPFTAAQSAVPAPSATSTYPTLPPVTPNPPPAMNSQPFSNYAANVPVGGTSGALNSPYVAQLGANGTPVGSSPSVPMTSTPSPLPIAAPPAATPAAAPVTPAAATNPNAAIFVGNSMLGNQSPGVSNQVAKQGGRIQKFAPGGAPSSAEADPFYVRQDAREMFHPEGLVMGGAGGRTDVHNINVPAGAYVMPADVVSGLGEGNTMAGSNVIDKMMHSGPYGTQLQRPGRGPGPPHPLRAEKTFAKGGRSKASQTGQPTPIVVAGGEHILYPQTIMAKFGNLDHGHKVLDALVLRARKQTIHDMKHLQGPKK